MSRQEFLQLIITMLPIEAEVTQEIIDKSDVFDCSNCIGYNTFKDKLPELPDGFEFAWGGITGSVSPKDGASYNQTLGLIADTPMMNIRKPQKVSIIEIKEFHC